MRRERGWRASQRRAGGVFAEINITPFTDVLLVLLIILLIAGSSLTPTGIALQGLAPVKRGKPSANQAAERVEIVLGEDQRTRVTMGGEDLDFDALSSLPRTLPVVIRADSQVRSGPVVATYDQVTGLGFQDVALGSPTPDVRPESR